MPTPTKIYIASAFSEHPLAIHYADLLRPEYEVTHKWWEKPDWMSQSSFLLSAEIRPTHEQFRLASEDEKGVDSATVFWLLSPPEGLGAGCFVELGMALSRRRKMAVVVSGPHRTLFARLTSDVYPRHEDALAALKTWVRPIA
jgi:hypothetical protein